VFCIRVKNCPEDGVEVYPTVKSENGNPIPNAIVFYKHCKPRKALKNDSECVKFKFRISSLSSKDRDNRRIVVFNAEQCYSVGSLPKTVLSKKTRKRKRSLSPTLTPVCESEGLPKSPGKQRFSCAEDALRHFKANIEQVLNKWTSHILALQNKIEEQDKKIQENNVLLNQLNFASSTGEIENVKSLFRESYSADHSYVGLKLLDADLKSTKILDY